MKIKLNHDKVVVIDDEDFDLLCDYHWYAHWDGYKWNVRTDFPRNMAIQNLIVGPAPEGMVIDHINGDRFDNRKSNLRFATRTESAQNRGKFKNSFTSYKGVSRKGKRFQARITVGGQTFSLGSFGTEEEAAKAYDEAAKEHFGEFAKLNFGG